MNTFMCSWVCVVNIWERWENSKREKGERRKKKVHLKGFCVRKKTYTPCRSCARRSTSLSCTLAFPVFWSHPMVSVPSSCDQIRDVWLDQTALIHPFVFLTNLYFCRFGLGFRPRITNYTHTFSSLHSHLLLFFFLSLLLLFILFNYCDL
jgi:hypothetical protein